MKKTGEILKKTREEKQLSIHEIGLSLKINSKVLKAIEDGDLESLPAKTFLRGFVQSYAQYLKLNVDDVLKLFTEEMGTTKPQTVSLHIGTEKTIPLTVETNKPEGAVAPVQSKPKEASSAHEAKPVTISSGKRFRNVTLIASVIVLLTLILITKRVIDRYQNEAITPEPEAVTAAQPVQTQPAVVEPTVSAEPPPESTSAAPPTTPLPPPFNGPPVDTAAPKEEAPNTPPATAFVSPSTTGPAPRSAVTPPVPPPVSAAPKVAPPATTTNTTSFTAQKPSEPKPQVTSTLPSATTAPSAAPAPVEPAKPVVAEKPESKPEVAAEVKPAIKNIELIIEALDNVDVEYSTAGGKNEKFHLEPEQLHTIKTRTGVKLNVSNGGAISIIVNGKEIGIPGVLGKPIKLTY